MDMDKIRRIWFHRIGERGYFTMNRSTFPEISCAAGRKVLFVSDCHLRPEAPERQERLLALLEAEEERLDALVLLGDLFEFWLGYATVVPWFYLPVLSFVQRLRQRGVPVYFFAGNHDFRPGPFIERDLGVTVHDGPAFYRLGGKVVVLSHGDEVDRSPGYRLLRALLHAPGVQRLLLLVHPDRAWRLALTFSRLSHRRRASGCGPWRLGYHQDRLWRRLAEAGAEVVLSGHLHTPFERRFTWAGRQLHLLNTGDFVEHFTCVEYTPQGGFRLRRDDGGDYSSEGPRAGATS
jgi:UDP-2,3-diacylglucosamine hydrolase